MTTDEGKAQVRAVDKKLGILLVLVAGAAVGGCIWQAPGPSGGSSGITPPPPPSGMSGSF